MAFGERPESLRHSHPNLSHACVDASQLLLERRMRLNAGSHFLAGHVRSAERAHLGSYHVAVRVRSAK